MDDKGYKLLIAILVVVAVVLAIILLLMLLGCCGHSNDGPVPDDDPDDHTEKIPKDMHTYDPVKGWGSWNPSITTASVSQAEGSAYMDELAETWFRDVYGSDTSIEGKTAPDGYLGFTSLVGDSGGKLSVTSKVSTGTGFSETVVTFDGVPDYIICPASMAYTLYEILSVGSGSQDDVLSDLFGLVYASDSTFADDFLGQYGVSTEGWSGIELSSMTSVMVYQEEYLQLFEGIAATGSTVCFMGTSEIGSDAYSWLSEKLSEFGSYSVLFDVNSVASALASIEAIAYITGHGDVAGDVIGDVRDGLYGVSEASRSQENAYSYKRAFLSVGMDRMVTDGKGTLVDDLMGLFRLTNMVSDSGRPEIYEEPVIVKQPDVVVFRSPVGVDDPAFDKDRALRVKTFD